ncbi:hypothetical protein DPMN_070779 [Dreissena polymorpha]|uniref:Uncharacterized protein n=1 Tax=Dreissena polymorpha TaxID=45954 RepID=A0A9D4BVC8_DREPO|nr:hypothetical protein DPMN_070779 [Dreissena polymorpha]
MRERESTMTRVRQYDDESAKIRWRERDGENARTRQCDNQVVRLTGDYSKGWWDFRLLN